MTDKIAAGTAAPAPPAFARRLAGYAGSSLLLRVLRLAYAYAKPKFLTPALLGLWNILSLIPVYATNLHLGARTSLGFRLPALVAAGDAGEAARHKATVYRFTLAYSVVLAAVLALLAWLGPFAVETRAGLATMAVLIVLTWYYEFQFAVLKAERRFDLVSRANVIDGVGLAVLGVPLVVWHGIYGVFAGAVLTKAIVVAYLRLKHPIAIRGRLDPGLLRTMIGEGLPILGFAFGLTLLGTADRLIIVSLLGKEAVGYYAVAVVAAEFLLQIPVSARDMLEPQLMAQLASKERGELWRDYFLRPLANTACYFCFLIGAVVFLAEDILHLILPAYVASAVPAAILAFGCYFLALTHVMRGVLVAHGWQRRGLPILGAGVAVDVALGYFLVAGGWGIAGAAVASSVAFALVFCLLLGLLLARGPYRDGAWWVPLSVAVSPVAAALGMVAALEWAFASVAWPHAVASLIKLALYSVGLAAGIWALGRAVPVIRIPRWLQARGA